MMIDLVGRLALTQHDAAEPSQRNVSTGGISFADELSTTMTTTMGTIATTTSTDTAFETASLTPTTTTHPRTTALPTTWPMTASVSGEPSETPTRSTQARSRGLKKDDPRPSQLGRSEKLDGWATSPPSVAARGASSQLGPRDARLASELEDLSLLAKVSRSSSTMHDVEARPLPAADDKARASLAHKSDASSRLLTKGSFSTPSTTTKLEASTRVASAEPGASTQSVAMMKTMTTVERIMGSLREQDTPHVLNVALTRDPIVEVVPTSSLRELSLMVAELQTCVAAQSTAAFVDVDDDLDHIGGQSVGSVDSSFELDDVDGLDPVLQETTESDRPVTIEPSVWNGASSLAYRDPVMRTPETTPLSESVRTTVDHLRSLLPEGGRLLEVRSNFVRLELSHAAGPLHLEVMVRSGVVDVRAHGTAAAEMAWRVPELAAALQGTGMRLGAFEVQSVRRTKDSAGSGGGSGGSHTESRQKSDAPVGKTARRGSTFGLRGAG